MTSLQVALGEVCTVTMGQAPEGKTYNAVGNGIPLLAGAGDLGEIEPRPTRYTTAPTQLARPGDIILCVRATLGRTNWARREYCLGRGVAGLRARAEKLDSLYLWHWLQTQEPSLERRARGSTFRQVTRDAVESLRIPLPPLPEQRRIAAILDKADAVRRKRQQTLDLADQFLRSAFLDMFGDPVTNPKGWPLRRIEDVADDARGSMVIGPFGSDLKVSDYKPSGHPVIFVRDVQEMGFSWVSGVCVDDEKFERLAAHQVTPGDVVITKMGTPPGIAAVYPPGMASGVVTADIIRIRADASRTRSEYVAAVLNSAWVRPQMKRITEGITRPKVTLGGFRLLLVPVPPLEEQARWAQLLSARRAVTSAATKASLTASELFDSLLQRGFGGKLAN